MTNQNRHSELKSMAERSDEINRALEAFAQAFALWYQVHWVPVLKNLAQQIGQIKSSPEFRAWLDTLPTDKEIAYERSQHDVQQKRRPGRHKWGGPNS